jgi:hypothetical protein
MWNKISCKYGLPLMIYNIIKYTKSRDSVVGIATGYGLDDKGFGV